MTEILGYEFGKPELLDEALTSPSYRMSHPEARDNQRLEFLGDAVLQILASEVIYREFPEEDEGNLTMRRQHMVSATALCAVAEQIALAKALRFCEYEPVPRYSQKVYCDAIEALIGAAYLDGGLTAARKVFKALGIDELGRGEPWAGNPKGELQLRAQKMVPPRRPDYRIINISGKSHAPNFTIEVRVEGIGVAQATAGSRREAEALAAAKLLKSGGKEDGD